MGFFDRFKQPPSDRQLELLKTAYFNVFDYLEKDIKKNAPIDYHEIEIVVFSIFIVAYSYGIGKGFNDGTSAQTEKFFQFMSGRMAEFSCRNTKNPSGDLFHHSSEMFLKYIKQRGAEYAGAWDKDMNNLEEGFVNLIGVFLDNCFDKKITSKQKADLAEPHLLILPNVINDLRLLFRKG